MTELTLFWTFFQIGLFTFGGGYAMLPLAQQKVLSNGWMENSEIINFIAVSESTPGPFAVNLSTFVGMRTAGLAGALSATLGVVLPSFLVILLVAKYYDRFRKSLIVDSAMKGLRPTVVGLIASSLVSVGKSVFFPEALVFDASFFVSLAIFLVMAVLAFSKKHPILIIGLSAAAGIAAGYALGL